MSTIKTLLKSLPGLGSLVLIMVLAGCGTMSSATVELSTEITARTKDIEKTHIYAVNTYFDSEKQRIEEFMSEKWTPLFLRNLIGTSQILEDLKKTQSIGANTRDNLAVAAQEYLTDPSEGKEMANKIVDALNKKRKGEDAAIRTIIKKYIPKEKQDAAVLHMMTLLDLGTPAVLIMEFAEAANEQIQKQQQALVKPVEDARAKTLEELRQAYADIYAGQGVITARLEAAVRKGEQQARLVYALGGKGTAAKINARLTSLAEGMNSVFDEIEDHYTEQAPSSDTSGQGADYLMGILKQGLKKALEHAGFIEPKPASGPPAVPKPKD
jgi:hypothetical protein